MIRVNIGGAERDLDDADAQWVNEQINRRRQAGEDICVRVSIDCPPLRINLATPDCGSGGGGRPPRPDEKEILDLWNERKLNQSDFTGGNLVAFLKQLAKRVPC